MAATFFAASALGGIAATPATLSVAYPASVAANDIAFIMVLSKNITLPANELNTPTGYTLLGSLGTVDSAVAADDFRYGVYWRRLDGSEGGTSVTVSRAGTSTLGFYALMHVFRGASTTANPDAPQVTATTVVADNITYPAFTPSAAAHVIYMGFYGNDLTTAGTIAGTDPTLTNRVDLETATGTDCTMIVASGDSSGAAIASRTQSTTSTADSSSLGFVTALLPVAAGVSAAPGAGALTASGVAPTVTVTANQTVAAGVGALSATGFAPTIAVSNNQNVTPGTGTATLAGLAASVSVGVRVAAGLGAITATGFAPTATTSANQTVAPALGQATLTGFAPTVTAGNQIVALPGTGAATLTGFAPVASVSNNQRVLPGVGAATATGLAPTVTASNHRIVAPGLGSATLTGFAPTVTATAPQAVQPGVGILVATGFAPLALVQSGVYELVRIDALEQIEAPVHVAAVGLPAVLAAIDAPATVSAITLPATLSAIDAPARVLSST